MAKRGHTLEDYEVSLIKAMLKIKESHKAKGTLKDCDYKNNQDILAYFTRPSRSVNHARITEIEDAMSGAPMHKNARKYVSPPVATKTDLQTFLDAWPNIDPKTGLHIEDDELLIKSREAMLFAVQAFNNPTAYFKAEMFIVSAIISWTYLLHYYFQEGGIDYIYRNKDGTHVTTENGADKLFDLTKCLKVKECPLDGGTKRNLEYLLGVRHEIEHRKTTRIDHAISAKLQACCLNHNRYLKKLAGVKYGLDGELSLALQFSRLDANQKELLKKESDLPAHIKTFNAQFEHGLTEDQYNDPNYSYRVALVRKLTNNKNKADSVVEIVGADSDIEKEFNTVIKEREKTKYRAKDILTNVHAKGFMKFNMYNHTQLWKSLDGKNVTKGFGIDVAGTWYWYQTWLDQVLLHVNDNEADYKEEEA